MKVLIYEPGTEGHHPVYLRYIDEAFRAAGCETVIVTQSYGGAPWTLVALAARSGVRVIFVCTMDGIFGWMTILGIGARIAGIRVAGIYFLFNNLYEGWKSVFWRAVLRFKIVYSIFVPDLMYENNVDSSLRHRIIRIPDAWDSRVLKSLPRQIGLNVFGISDAASCVFLVIGAISLRKGLGQLLWCAANWDYTKRPKLRLLIAGKLDAAARALIDHFVSVNRSLKDNIIVIDTWLSDEEICQCYAAASYLCALYPKSFNVSISTVIRAFAVGRPVIVGAHGMMGEIVRELHAGFVCDTSNSGSVQSVFEQAYDAYCLDENRGTYEHMAIAGQSIGAGSELEKFKSTLGRWVSENRWHSRL